MKTVTNQTQRFIQGIVQHQELSKTVIPINKNLKNISRKKLLKYDQTTFIKI